MEDIMPINVFSRSVSGYNRHEVDEYIADMNRAFARSKRDYEKKIEILEAENSRLSRKLEEGTTMPAHEVSDAPRAAIVCDELTEKSRRYDEISRQVGEILMNANAEASIIIRGADEKVRATLTGTMSTLRGELTTLIAKLNELLDSAEETLAVDDEQSGDGEGA